MSQSSPTSNGLHATGKVPGKCGRQILIDNRVRERRERVCVLAWVSYMLMTRHSTTLEKHTLLGFDQHLNCLTLINPHVL